MTVDSPTRRVGPYELQVVWPDATAELRQKVAEFWQANKALPPNAPIEAALHRAKQLVVVAQHNDGKIAAVSTAVPTQIEQLGFPCFYYRTFVAPEHRQLWMLSLDILLTSYRALNQRFQEGHHPNVLGIFLELQNADLERHFKYAVWQLEGMNVVFIGKSASGLHRRVWYFDGALVP